jgi:hypothetical protein
LVYRPTDPNDPSIKELARDIQKRGILEPLVLTKDHFILSGHRRFAAAKLAKLTEVPCRISNITSFDPQFIEQLAAHNQQRVKNLSEVLRELVVAANPESTYSKLVLERKKCAQLDHDLQTIELRGAKARRAISPAKTPMLDAVLRIISDHRKYWPLSDRQIHYRLLNGPPLTHAGKPDSVYRNRQLDYRKLTDLLTRARLNRLIPWEAISDITRPVKLWNTHPSPGPFIKQQLDRFLAGYYRDLLQSQPNHIEIVAEKLTIQGLVDPIAREYCIPCTIGRGFSSLDPRHKVAERFRASGKESLILLLLSDFDPSGEKIAHSFARSLRDDFRIEERSIKPIKVALTRDQVVALQLPPIMTAKENDPNYDRFIERYVDSTVHELESVEPDELQRILREAIQSVLDLELFNAEIEREKRDSVFLDAVRRTVLEAVKSLDLDDDVYS